MRKELASTVHYQNSIRELAKQSFWKNPGSAPERIAKHYCAHAMLALQTCELIKCNRLAPSEALEAFINENIEIIKRNHVAEFGTDLIAPQPHERS